MLAKNTTIREITNDELIKSAKVIRDSFKAVAIEFSLTKENCPTHPSFMDARQLYKLRDRAIKLFGFFFDDKQVGLVAIEKANEKLYYMERLAVLPKVMNRNYGEELVKFVYDFVEKSGGQKLSIGIINEHTVLKYWYIGLGFKEINTQVFNHLPFTVCFMEKDI